MISTYFTRRFCLVDETYLETVRKYPNREPHSSYLGASRQVGRGSSETYSDAVLMTSSID